MLAWWKRDSLAGGAAQHRWLGEPPAKGVLAPSEIEPETSRHFIRDRDGHLRLRVGTLIFVVMLAVLGDPFMDLIRKGVLARDLQDYAVKAGIGITVLVVGLLFELRKLKNGD